MIPVSFPSEIVNQLRSCVVYRVTPGATDIRWKDYIPVKTVLSSTSNINTTDIGGAQAVKVITSTTGLSAWKDYIPVAEVTGSLADAWETSNTGYIPVYDTSATINLSFEDKSLSSVITFTRASVATRVNANGDIEEVASNVPRLTFNPVTKECLGLLIEGSSTNYVPNSTATGAAVPSTLPTGWADSGGTVGINYQVVSVGTESGIPYIDYRISGTCTTAGFKYIGFVSGFALVDNTRLSQSIYAKAVAGSLTNINSIRIGTNANVSGVYAAAYPLIFSPSAILPLISQRYSQDFLVTGTPTVTDGFFYLAFDCALGEIDYTVRIGYPQVEASAGGITTSVIRTSSGARTRSVDFAKIDGTNFSSWFSATEGTFVVSFYKASTQPLENARLISLSNTTAAEIMLLTILVGTPTVRYTVIDNSVSQFAIDVGSFNTGATNKVSFRYQVDNFASSLNSVASVGGTIPDTIPTVTELSIGSQSSLLAFNGIIKNITYYPVALSNSLLESLSS